MITLVKDDKLNIVGTIEAVDTSAYRRMADDLSASPKFFAISVAENKAHLFETFKAAEFWLKIISERVLSKRNRLYA